MNFKYSLSDNDTLYGVGEKREACPDMEQSAYRKIILV